MPEETDTTLLGGEPNEETVNETETPENPDSTSDQTDEDTGGDTQDTPEPWDVSALKAPEGFEEVDSAALEAFVPLANEMKLSAEQAQKFVDLYGDKVKSLQESQEATWKSTLDGWKDEAMKDTDIGGVKLTDSITAAKTTINTFGNQKVMDILNQSGLGNNVEVIRMLAKIGKAIREDKFVANKASDSQPKTHAQIMFPNMN